MTNCFRLTTSLILCLMIPSIGLAQWKQHTIRQLNGRAEQIRLKARFQIVTESWNRVVAVPYIANLGKDRLIMLIGCDYPHRSYVLTSKDGGGTWTQPRTAKLDKNGKPGIGLGTALQHLGNGRLVFYEDGIIGVGKPSRWFSSDYGKTWGNPVSLGRTSDNTAWHIWDPPLVDRDPKTGKVIRLVETGYSQSGRNSQAYIRFSKDLGKTWSKSTKVPQWKGANEVALFRAANGNIVAACRTEIPDSIKGTNLDHYEGMGVSISKDNGRTWSNVNKLYDYGRHHPSLVMAPKSKTIVMTYVVRLGFVKDQQGFAQFGIEAVVSHDHGKSWDLDHRYLLHVWSSKRTGKTYWWPSSQATSSTVLKDGSIVTAFGTGYRIQAGPNSPQAPRDVGLIRWRLNSNPVNSHRDVRDARFDSKLRNVFDPKPNNAKR